MNTPEIKRLKLDSHEGKISEDEYYEELIRRGGITDKSDIEHGKDIFREAMLDFEFTEGVADTLHRLKSDGLKLGVVTNTYNTTEEKLSWFRRIGIDKVWDSFATSAALEPFDGKPQDALFVAHAQLELDGAKALGMSTVSFNRDDDTVTGDHNIDRFTDLPALVASLRTVAPAK
jgi:FMN phosphatase YigB (HAD superfamily)